MLAVDVCAQTTLDWGFSALYVFMFSSLLYLHMHILFELMISWMCLLQQILPLCVTTTSLYTHLKYVYTTWYPS